MYVICSCARQSTPVTSVNPLTVIKIQFSLFVDHREPHQSHVTRELCCARIGNLKRVFFLAVRCSVSMSNMRDLCAETAEGGGCFCLAKYLFPRSQHKHTKHTDSKPDFRFLRDHILYELCTHVVASAVGVPSTLLSLSLSLPSRCGRCSTSECFECSLCEFD